MMRIPGGEAAFHDRLVQLFQPFPLFTREIVSLISVLLHCVQHIATEPVGITEVERVEELLQMETGELVDWIMNVKGIYRNKARLGRWKSLASGIYDCLFNVSVLLALTMLER